MSKLAGMGLIGVGGVLLAFGFKSSRRQRLREDIAAVLEPGDELPPNEFTAAQRSELERAAQALDIARRAIKAACAQPHKMWEAAGELAAEPEVVSRSSMWLDVATLGMSWVHRQLTRPRDRSFVEQATDRARWTRQAQRILTDDALPWPDGLAARVIDRREPYSATRGRYVSEAISTEVQTALNMLNVAMRTANVGELPQVVSPAQLVEVLRSFGEPQWSRLALAFADRDIEEATLQHLAECERENQSGMRRFWDHAQLFANPFATRSEWAQHYRQTQRECIAARVLVPVRS